MAGLDVFTRPVPHCKGRRSHTPCLLMAHLHGAPTPCPFESGAHGTSPMMVKHQGRCNVRIKFTHFAIHKDVDFVHQHKSLFINIPCRTSDCVERMVVDPVRGLVQVAYAKGNIYHYTHTYRRAIANLILNPNMSWVLGQQQPVALQHQDTLSG